MGKVVGEEEEVENKFGLIVMYTRGSSKENVLVLMIEWRGRACAWTGVVEKRMDVGKGAGKVLMMKTRRQLSTKDLQACVGGRRLKAHGEGEGGWWMECRWRELADWNPLSGEKKQ
jgi:hypothetical protein